MKTIMNIKTENDQPSCLSLKDKNYRKWFLLMKHLLSTTAFQGSERDLNLKNSMNFNWVIKQRKQPKR